MLPRPGAYVAEPFAGAFAWIPWGLMRRGMGVVRELRAAREIARVVGQQAPDMVHAFSIQPVVYLSVVVAWRSLCCAATPSELIANLPVMDYVFFDALRARVVRTLQWPLLAVCRRQPRAHTVEPGWPRSARQFLMTRFPDTTEDDPDRACHQTVEVDAGGPRSHAASRRISRSWTTCGATSARTCGRAATASGSWRPVRKDLRLQ